MGDVDIIIPTRGQRRIVDCITSLTHIPFSYRLHVITGHTFEEGINEGIKRSRGDLIFMDDDVRFTQETFKDFDKYYDHADIFGFKLLFENGSIQHGGISYVDGSLGHFGYKQIDAGQCDTPQYVVGVTGALIYVKRHVIDVLGGYKTDYKGVQFVDVDFCFRAITHGFRILYIPKSANHFEQYEKNCDKEYSKKLDANYKELSKRFEPVKSLLSNYPKPCQILQ